MTLAFWEKRSKFFINSIEWNGEDEKDSNE